MGRPSIKRILVKTFLTFLLLVGFSALQAQSLYFPSIEAENWETLSPDSLNWCQEKIDSLYTMLDEEETKSFIILKDGKIVLEQYFNGHGADSLWIWYSAGKSLTAALVGIAQQEGDLSITDKTSDYLGSGWTTLAPAKEDLITVKTQLSMSTGLDEQEFFCTDSACLTYVADAGTRWVYHNSPYSLLRDVVEDATGINYNIYTTTRIKQKIGMSGFWLPIGYNNFYFSKARDMARFGLLIQGNGTWHQTPVITDATYMSEMLNSSQNLNPAYGYLWWLNGKNSFIAPESPQSFPGPLSPDAPMDLYTAAGAQGQYISVSPSLGLVMIRQGESADPDLAATDLLNTIWDYILDLECAGVGLAETQKEEQVWFQNPVDQRIELHGLDNSRATYQLYDVQGRLLQTGSTYGVIDVAPLQAGTYLLRLEQEGLVWSERVVKGE